MSMQSSAPPFINSVPTGTVLMFAAFVAPSGYLECDGSTVSRTTFAALFAKIGTTFGAGDGATTFNLPGMNSRFPLGRDGAGRPVGNTGGAESYVLTDTLTAAAGADVTVLSGGGTFSPVLNPYTALMFIIKT